MFITIIIIIKSGKLVQKMFSKIHTLVEDSNALICILIDEVGEPSLSLPLP